MANKFTKDEAIILRASGIEVTALKYGATLQSLILTKADGSTIDVMLGYDSVEEYKEHTCFFGATIGRVGNRIGGAEFTLNGKRYPVAMNDGVNHLHGGIKGFDKYVWDVTAQSENAVTFSRVSPDGEEGYPGTMKVNVTFELDNEKALHIRYEAVCDADTILNLTNHAYFNLNGHDSGSAMDHLLQLNADLTTENDAGCLPTGKIYPVDGTPFDFRKPRTLSEGLAKDDPRVNACGGYDHNFVLNGTGMRVIGTLTGEKTGIAMDVITDQPGVQLYGGNFITPMAGKDGAHYDKRHSICLETQHFPNAMRCPNFPSIVLKKGEVFRSETVYRFRLP